MRSQRRVSQSDLPCNTEQILQVIAKAYGRITEKRMEKEKWKNICKQKKKKVKSAPQKFEK